MRSAALVALDLITTPRDLVEEARREIERIAGIPGAVRDDQRHAFPHRTGSGSEQSVWRPVRARQELPRRTAGEDRRGRAPGRGHT